MFITLNVLTFLLIFFSLYWNSSPHNFLNKNWISGAAHAGMVLVKLSISMEAMYLQLCAEWLKTANIPEKNRQRWRRTPPGRAWVAAACWKEVCQTVTPQYILMTPASRRISAEVSPFARPFFWIVYCRLSEPLLCHLSDYLGEFWPRRYFSMFSWGRGGCRCIFASSLWRNSALEVFARRIPRNFGASSSESDTWMRIMVG